MDPFTYAAIGLGIQAAGGLVSYFANQSAADKAALLADENFKQWMAIQLPDPADQALAFQQLRSAGTLSPQLEQKIQQGPSALNQVTADPRTVAAQQNALDALQKEGFHGGLSLQDQADIQQAQQQNQNIERGHAAAIMQDLARRGASNSGFGVAAQLSNAQAAADRNATAGLNVAGSAQQRALDAIQAAGSLAGNIQQNDLAQKNKVASAADSINRFNTTNSQDVQRRNVNSLNAAQAANLANNQRIADANVGLSNQEQAYNKGLIQQNYQNKVAQAEGASGARSGQAQAAQQQGANVGNLATNLANGIGGTLAAQANREYWTKYFDSQKPGNGSNGQYNPRNYNPNPNTEANGNGYGEDELGSFDY